MPANFASLNSLHELKREIDTGGKTLGGSEFAEAMPSQVRAAIATVHFEHRLLGSSAQDSLFAVENLRDTLVAKSWLHALVFRRTFISTFSDIGARIDTDTKNRDLGAILNPFNENNLPASLLSIPYVDLPAAILAVEYVDLGGNIQTIPYVNLGALGGGHFPAHLPAILSVTQPVDIPAFIRSAFSSTSDIGASLTQVGAYVDIGAFIKIFQTLSSDLGGSLTVRIPKDLLAIINGYDISDIGGSLVTQRESPPLRGIIAGWARQVISNMTAYIRRIDNATSDIPVEPFKARVSTHTSDKLVNLSRVSRPFYQNVYAFGTQRAGFFILTLEPIFGIFPDLHAEITATDFSRSNIGGFVRPAFRLPLDLPTVLSSVTPTVYYNKIKINLIPMINIGAELNARGGYKDTKGSITPVHHSSTGTASDAGYITTAFSYKFFLGTTKGVFIPPENIPTIRITTFVNNHPRPDLHAYVRGWAEGNIGASISTYPYEHLPATIFSTDLSRIVNIAAQLIPAYTYDLSSTITPSGGFSSLLASVGASGGYKDLGVEVIASINIASLAIVSVSTKPFSELGALINYTSLVSCAPSSAISSIFGYIKPIITGKEDNVSNMSAELTSLRDINDLKGDVVGRKFSRIRILSLSFRANIRSSSAVFGVINPVHQRTNDVLAEIFGKSHETDIPASITTVSYAPPKFKFTRFEQIVNLKKPLEIKTVMLSFKSQVSSYVYEQVANSVYATDRGTWAIDLRTVISQENFYDLSENNRSYTLDDSIQEFYSIDEAIRNAIVILCERRKVDLSASLEARGGSFSIGASTIAVSADRIKDLISSLVAVENSPDISAQINMGPGSSGYGALLTSISSLYKDNTNLSTYINGLISGDLAAEITPS